MAEKLRCCFCGTEIEGYGNDPRPIKTARGDRCCDECNALIVVPTRIAVWKEDIFAYGYAILQKDANQLLDKDGLPSSDITAIHLFKNISDAECQARSQSILNYDIVQVVLKLDN